MNKDDSKEKFFEDGINFIVVFAGSPTRRFVGILRHSIGSLGEGIFSPTASMVGGVYGTNHCWDVANIRARNSATSCSTLVPV